MFALTVASTSAPRVASTAGWMAVTSELMCAGASAGDTFGASACSGSLAIVPNGRDSRMAATAVVRMENLDFMVLVASDVRIAVVRLFSGLTRPATAGKL